MEGCLIRQSSLVLYPLEPYKPTQQKIQTPLADTSCPTSTPTRTTLCGIMRAIWAIWWCTSIVTYRTSQKTRHDHGWGDTFYLSNIYRDTPYLNFPPPHNGAIHVPSNTLKNIIESTSEAKLGALFLNACKVSTVRTMLKELDHPQPPTPIITDN